jgi:hypothetical protein
MQGRGEQRGPCADVGADDMRVPEPERVAGPDEELAHRPRGQQGLAALGVAESWQAAEPLSAFSPPTMPRRRRVATRRLTPTVLSFGAVIVTAIVLLIYFAGR